jgi:hypothetical protein
MKTTYWLSYLFIFFDRALKISSENIFLSFIKVLLNFVNKFKRLFCWLPICEGFILTGTEKIRCQSLWTRHSQVTEKYKKLELLRDCLARLRWTVGGLDRSGDDPLIGFEVYLLVFNFELYFLQRCCKKVALLNVIGQPYCNCVRLLATLFQICSGWSEGVGNPLANYLQGIRGYWQLSDKFLRGCGNFANSTYLSEGS